MKRTHRGQNRSGIEPIAKTRDVAREDPDDQDFRDARGQGANRVLDRTLPICFSVSPGFIIQ